MAELEEESPVPIEGVSSNGIASLNFDLEKCIQLQASLDFTQLKAILGYVLERQDLADQEIAALKKVKQGEESQETEAEQKADVGTPTSANDASKLNEQSSKDTMDENLKERIDLLEAKLKEDRQGFQEKINFLEREIINLKSSSDLGTDVLEAGSDASVKEGQEDNLKDFQHMDSNALQNRIQDLHDKFQSMSSSVQVLDADVQNLKDKSIDTAPMLGDKLEKDAKQVQDTLQSFHQCLDELKARVSSNESNIEATHKGVVDTTRELQSKLSELQSEKLDRSEFVDALSQGNISSDAPSEDLNEEGSTPEELSSRIKAIVGRVQGIEGRLTGAEITIKGKVAKSEFDIAVAALKALATELKGVGDTGMTEDEQLDASNGEVTSDISALSSAAGREVAAKLKILPSFTARDDKLQSEMESLADLVTQVQSRSSEALASAGAAASHPAELDLTELRDSLANLAKVVKILQLDFEGIVDRLQDNESNIKETEELAQNASDSSKTSQDALKSMDVKLDSGLSTLDEQVSALKRSMTAILAGGGNQDGEGVSEGAVAALMQQIESLQSQFASIKTTAMEAQGTAGIGKSIADKATESINQLKKSIDGLQRDLVQRTSKLSGPVAGAGNGGSIEEIDELRSEVMALKRHIDGLGAASKQTGSNEHNFQGMLASLKADVGKEANAGEMAKLSNRINAIQGILSSTVISGAKALGLTLNGNDAALQLPDIILKLVPEINKELGPVPATDNESHEIVPENPSHELIAPSTGKNRSPLPPVSAAVSATPAVSQAINIPSTTPSEWIVVTDELKKLVDRALDQNKVLAGEIRNLYDAYGGMKSDYNSWLDKVRQSLETKAQQEDLQKLWNYISQLAKRMQFTNGGQRDPDGNYASLVTKPLAGFRCLSCDKQLEPLAPQPPRFLPWGGMPSRPAYSSRAQGKRDGNDEVGTSPPTGGMETSPGESQMEPPSLQESPEHS